MSLNLKDFEALDQAEIPLKDADGNVFPGVSVTLYSPATDRVRDAGTRWRKRNKKLNSGDEAAFLKSNAEFLADVTAAFKGIEYEGLQGREMALGIYSNPKLGFIAQQVLQAVNDWGKFSPKGVSDSLSMPLS